ncbi:MAG: hypothetical protein HFJ02_01940 [Bacilli bacterium]|nr:hypothetical protein [Bacilli bacterium]
MNLIKETSERSKKLNKGEAKINSFPHSIQLSFEGVAIKNLKVTAVFDRGCYKGPNLCLEEEETLLKDAIQNEPHYKIKTELASTMGVKWYYIIYEYKTEYSIVLDLEEYKVVKKYPSFLALGKWLSLFSDSVPLSNYEENGLPEIDTIMRKNKYSWPGNMDGLLINNNKIVCVIEYQNTSKKRVADHDNNDYMESSNYRKGDGRRWLVIKLIEEALKTKTVVIVWSYNEQVIAIKPIKNYQLNQYNNVSKIDWQKKVMCNINTLTEEEFLKIVTTE